jgi:WD40 repeat protein
LTVHPSGNIIATGTRAPGLSEKYLTPICVWESESKKILSLIQDFHTRMIHCLEFSADGVFLFSFSDEYSIAIHDWQIG